MVRYFSHLSQEDNEVVSSAASVARLEVRTPFKFRLGRYRQAQSGDFLRYIARALEARAARTGSQAIKSLADEILAIAKK